MSVSLKVVQAISHLRTPPWSQIVGSQQLQPIVFGWHEFLQSPFNRTKAAVLYIHVKPTLLVYPAVFVPSFVVVDRRPKWQHVILSSEPCCTHWNLLFVFRYTHHRVRVFAVFCFCARLEFRLRSWLATGLATKSPEPNFHSVLLMTAVWIKCTAHTTVANVLFVL